jgi:hypothetical protein
LKEKLFFCNYTMEKLPFLKKNRQFSLSGIAKL